MIMLMEFNYNWLLLSLIEYCNYFSLIKKFSHNEAHQNKNVLELVKDNGPEMISKWHGSNGKIGIKNDYVCNRYNYLNLLEYNSFYDFDRDIDILFYKNGDCMFFTMDQEKICYMSGEMYKVYRGKVLDGISEEMKL